jgi:hypothetical protein
MPLYEFSAVAVCVVLAGLAVFQGALISGAPLGRMAWGGQHVVLPVRLRIGIALSILLYALFGYAGLAKAGLVPLLVNEAFTAIFVWVLVAYFALGVLMNAISRSKPERLTMTPVAAALLGLYLFLAVA